MEHIQLFEEFINNGNKTELKNKWTVLSQDESNEWGIEENYYDAENEEDAVEQAREDLKKQGILNTRTGFRGFLADSAELTDFIETNF